MGVYLFDHFVDGNAVNGASFLKALTARCGTTEAMHTHLQEKCCCLSVGVENVADE